MGECVSGCGWVGGWVGRCVGLVVSSFLIRRLDSPRQGLHAEVVVVRELPHIAQLFPSAACYAMVIACCASMKNTKQSGRRM